MLVRLRWRLQLTSQEKLSGHRNVSEETRGKQSFLKLEGKNLSTRKAQRFSEFLKAVLKSRGGLKVLLERVRRHAWEKMVSIKAGTGAMEL